MKSTRWSTRLGAISLSLLLTALAAPAAEALTVTAFVVNQTCLNGDTVRVKLSATAQPSQQGLTYRWDFNNDGVWDTAASSDPTVFKRYTDEVRRTARVRVRNANGVVAFDRVTFTTLRCGGGGGD